MPAGGRHNPKRTVKALDAAELWNFALKTLGQRALSSGELREKLRRKAANPDDVPGVLSKLKEYGYLNDARMADSFATARRESRGFGKMRVLRDLQKRRVAPGLAREAVEKVYSGVDEADLIEAYLQKKYRTANLSADLKDEKKLAGVYRRLRTAGFSSGGSIRVLKRYAARADELEGLEDAAAGEST
jgi:regulatory protein